METTACLLLVHVFHLHCLSDHLTTDHGSQFISRFLKEVLLLNIQPHASTTSPSDGWPVRMSHPGSQTIPVLLLNHCQDSGVALLPLAEFTYSNTQHTSTQSSPFYVKYGFHPPFYPSVPLSTVVPAASDLVQTIHEANLKKCLEKAKMAYKLYDKCQQHTSPLKVHTKLWLSTEHLQKTNLHTK